MNINPSVMGHLSEYLIRYLDDQSYIRLTVIRAADRIAAVREFRKFHKGSIQSMGLVEEGQPIMETPTTPEEIQSANNSNATDTGNSLCLWVEQKWNTIINFFFPNQNGNN